MVSCTQTAGHGIMMTRCKTATTPLVFCTETTGCGDLYPSGLACDKPGRIVRKLHSLEITWVVQARPG